MKRYYLYVTLLIVSLMGTDLTDFSLAVWLLDQPDMSVSSYSLTWFFEAAPAIILSVFIGGLVDRWNKKKMIIYGQLAAGLGSITLLLLYLFNELAPWHIMLVAGIGSISSLFVFNAFYVSTRALVAKKDLVRAQALISMCFGFLKMGVPMLAPVLYKLIGLKYIFMIDIISFSISIAGFIFLGTIAIKNSTDKLSIKKDILLVKNFILQRKGFIYFLPFAFIGRFFSALILVLLTPLILDFSNEYVLGITYGSIGIGSIIGSMIMSNRRMPLNPTKKVITIYAFIGLIVTSFFISVNPYFIAAIGIVILTMFTIKDILYDTFLLTIVPEDMLGRFNGVMGFFIGIAGPLCYLFSGFIVDILSDLLKDSIYLAYYPGSVVTFSIVLLFTIMGALLTIFSFFFRHLKGIEELDQLYAKKLSNTNEKL